MQVLIAAFDEKRIEKLIAAPAASMAIAPFRSIFNPIMKGSAKSVSINKTDARGYLFTGAKKITNTKIAIVTQAQMKVRSEYALFFWIGAVISKDFSFVIVHFSFFISDNILNFAFKRAADGVER